MELRDVIRNAIPHLIAQLKGKERSIRLSAVSSLASLAEHGKSLAFNQYPKAEGEMKWSYETRSETPFHPSLNNIETMMSTLLLLLLLLWQIWQLTVGHRYAPIILYLKYK